MQLLTENAHSFSLHSALSIVQDLVSSEISFTVPGAAHILPPEDLSKVWAVELCIQHNLLALTSTAAEHTTKCAGQSRFALAHSLSSPSPNTGSILQSVTSLCIRGEGNFKQAGIFQVREDETYLLIKVGFVYPYTCPY